MLPQKRRYTFYRSRIGNYVIAVNSRAEILSAKQNTVAVIVYISNSLYYNGFVNTRLIFFAQDILLQMNFLIFFHSFLLRKNIQMHILLIHFVVMRNCPPNHFGGIIPYKL